MSYEHLTIDERCCIYQFKQSGLSIRQIAKALHRSPSTISRELKRNSSKIGIKYSVTRYYPNKAQELSDERHLRSHRSLEYDKSVIEYMQKKLEENWSPEQISYRETEEIEKVPSASSIYRYIHRGLLNKVTMRNLRRKGAFRRPAETRGKFNDGGRTIKKRDKSVYKREELGHWEGDTVESGRVDHKRKSKYCFVTLAERKSRKYIAILVPTRTAADVTPAIISALKEFPSDLVKTITFDRGKEFSGYEEIEKELNCKTYFCDPYCAWQKGTNENTNGLLREYYPKGMDLSLVDESELLINLDKMNNRPRKCLDYKTPNEVFGL